MSPPEIWGPPIWTFFHVMAEKIIEEKFNEVSPQIFMWMKRICHFLPCPECSMHATAFLGKIKPADINTKTKFIGMVYLFHNAVNVRKRKPLFNFANINKYKKVSIISAFQGFLKVYNTKGNMKLLTESFQRDIVIRDIHKWMRFNLHFFFTGSDQLNDDNLSVKSDNTESNNLPFDENSMMLSLTQHDHGNQNTYQTPYQIQKQFSMTLHKQNRFMPAQNYYNEMVPSSNISNSILDGIKYTYISNNNQELVQFTENSNNKTFNSNLHATENINFNISEKHQEDKRETPEVAPTENIENQTLLKKDTNQTNEDTSGKTFSDATHVNKPNISPAPLNTISSLDNDKLDEIKNLKSEIKENIEASIEKAKEIQNEQVIIIEKKLEKVNDIEQMIIKLSQDFDIVKKETQNIQKSENVDTILEKAIEKAIEKTKELQSEKESIIEKELEKVNELQRMIIKLSQDFYGAKNESESVEIIVEKAVDKAIEKALENVMSKTVEKPNDAIFVKDTIGNDSILSNGSMLLDETETKAENVNILENNDNSDFIVVRSKKNSNNVKKSKK